MRTASCLPKFDPALLHPMRQLWEQALNLSAARIAERFNVSKNTVIGQAHRREWTPRKVVTEPRTLHDRMDAEHDRMDAVLAETRAALAAARTGEMAEAAE